MGYRPNPYNDLPTRKIAPDKVLETLRGENPDASEMDPGARRILLLRAAAKGIIKGHEIDDYAKARPGSLESDPTDIADPADADSLPIVGGAQEVVTPTEAASSAEEVPQTIVSGTMPQDQEEEVGWLPYKD